jgi:hypothetical protein
MWAQPQPEKAQLEEVAKEREEESTTTKAYLGTLLTKFAIFRF